MRETSAQVPDAVTFDFEQQLTDRWSFHMTIVAFGLFLLSPMLLGMIRRFGAMVCGH